MDYFIVGLPRSRTAWLANFMTYDCSFCFHEGLVEAGSVEGLMDLKKLCPDAFVIGNSDSGLPLFADATLKAFPDARGIRDAVMRLRPNGTQSDALLRTEHK